MHYVFVWDARHLPLQDGSVDIVATDPPYGIAKPLQVRRGGKILGKGRPVDYSIADWDVNAPRLEEYLPELWRVLKPYGILIMFGATLKLAAAAEMIESWGGCVRHIAAWCVTNAVPQVFKVKWRNSIQHVLIATKNRGGGHAYRYQEGQGRDYYVCPSVPANKRWQLPDGTYLRTEKPVDVWEKWLLRWWGNRDGVIVDPFCGTGSTLVAAHRLGFKVIIGGDINPLCAVATLERLKAEMRRPLRLPLSGL